MGHPKRLRKHSERVIPKQTLGGGAREGRASVDAIGVWHCMHFSSMSACSLGVAATSADTTARQYGSRAAFAIIVLCHRSKGAMVRPMLSRIAVASRWFE